MTNKEAIEIVKSLVENIERQYFSVAEFYEYDSDYKQVKKDFFEALTK